MPKQEQDKPAVLFNLGDRVKIHRTGGMRGRIVELRGPLGPGGVQIYRVLVRRKPEPTYNSHPGSPKYDFRGNTARPEQWRAWEETLRWPMIILQRLVARIKKPVAAGFLT